MYIELYTYSRIYANRKPLGNNITVSMATAGMNHYNNNDEAPSAAVEADSDS